MQTLGRLGVCPANSNAQGSAGDKAGLRGTMRGARGRPIGDVLQKMDDNPARSGDDVYSILQELSPSDTVTLTIWRDGQTMTVLLRLGATTE